MSGSSFLHAGGFRFGDVLVVGLVLELSTEVLDSFVQAFLQGYLSTQDTNTYNIKMLSLSVNVNKQNDIKYCGHINLLID